MTPEFEARLQHEPDVLLWDDPRWNDPLIEDVSFLSNSHCVCLVACENVTDFTPLQTVHTLSITQSHVADVSALGSVSNLYLSICPHVKDVSALGNVDILHLSHCIGVTDVSALNAVRTLELHYCNSVRDVSSLRNVEYLHIADCDNVGDVSALDSVPNLLVERCGCADVARGDVSRFYEQDE